MASKLLRKRKRLELCTRCNLSFSKVGLDCPYFSRLVFYLIGSRSRVENGTLSPTSELNLVALYCYWVADWAVSARAR